MTSSSLVAPQDIRLHRFPPIAGSPPHSISNTMSFVKLSIFGTSFEVNLLSFLSHSSSHSSIFPRSLLDMSIFNPSAWVRHFLLFLSLAHSYPLIQAHSGWYGTLSLFRLGLLPPTLYQRIHRYSSAKDQLTGASVAIKKIMKPFSTPVLSKRTYRELKLLKHIQHENVSLCISTPSFPVHQARLLTRSSASAMSLSLHWRICTSSPSPQSHDHACSHAHPIQILSAIS
jgi:hypothetical protein